MKPKTMILMGLAVACGLGASYMTSRLLAERVANDEPEKVEILVATKNLSVHQKITNPEEFFEKKVVSKESEPPDAIRDFEALRGKTLKQGRTKGDHVTLGNLYDKGQLEIPEGHQAVSVRVNIETSSSGLATLPGSLVDLLLTIGAQDVGATKGVVLLENVLVLAADIRVNAEGEMAAPAQVVTFALKREDVLTVTVAKRMGEITLVLRNKDDKSVATEREIIGRKILDRNKRFVPEETVKVEPKVEPRVEPKVEPATPKIVQSHYDIVDGTESGQRRVTRVHYVQTEDGEITILRTEVLNPSGGNQPVPSAPAAKKESGRGEI